LHAGFNYGKNSQASGDLRQAELAALRLPNVAMSTAIDTGDFANIHPPDKQNPAKRLSDAALKVTLSRQPGVLLVVINILAIMHTRELSFAQVDVLACFIV
jgi:hypothetical protein